MIHSFQNWKAKRVAKLQASMERDYDGYSPSHDKTFVWPPKLFSLESPPWWAWLGLAFVTGMAVHHFWTFS